MVDGLDEHIHLPSEPTGIVYIRFGKIDFPEKTHKTQGRFDARIARKCLGDFRRLETTKVRKLTRQVRDKIDGNDFHFGKELPVKSSVADVHPRKNADSKLRTNNDYIRQTPNIALKWSRFKSSIEHVRMNYLEPSRPWTRTTGLALLVSNSGPSSTPRHAAPARK